MGHSDSTLIVSNMMCGITIIVFLLLGLTCSDPQNGQFCAGGQCNQNNFGGGSLGFGSFPGLGGGGGNLQQCTGSQCNQNNFAGGLIPGFFGRKKREAEAQFSPFGFNRGFGGGGGNLQQCTGGRCNQNNFGGRSPGFFGRKKREAEAQFGLFGSNRGFGGFGRGGFGGFGRGGNSQSCRFSQCNQNNFGGRKKRGVVKKVIGQVS